MAATTSHLATAQARLDAVETEMAQMKLMLKNLAAAPATTRLASTP